MTPPITDKEKFSLGIFILFLFGLLYLLMKPFLIVGILAVTIVVLSYPIFKRLTAWRFFGRHRKLSAFLMTLLVLFILIIPITVMATFIVEQLYTLVQGLDFRAMFGNLLKSELYVSTFEPYLQSLEQRLGTEINLLDFATKTIKERVVALYGFSPRVVLGTANYVIDFFLMLISIFFLYIEGPALFRFLIEISPLRDSHEMLLVDQFKTTIRAVIYGTFVTSIVQATLAFLAYWFLGVPVPFVFGVITFFISMIPFVGTAGVWVPVSIWLFLQGETGKGIGMVLWGILVIGLVDNLLKPLLMKGGTNAHPLLIFFALIGGISLMGPFGIFFGPVILASLIATVTIYRREVLKADG